MLPIPPGIPAPVPDPDTVPPGLPLLPRPAVLTEVVSPDCRVSAARPVPWPALAMASRSRPISPSKSPRDLSKTAPGSSPEPLPAEPLPEGLPADDGLVPEAVVPGFPLLAGVDPVSPEPDLPGDEEELEPLAPPLPGGDPPLAEPVVPAGGGMDGLVQAASHSVAASTTARVSFRCLSMEYCPLTDELKYSARADGTSLLHPALEGATPP